MLETRFCAADALEAAIFAHNHRRRASRNLHIDDPLPDVSLQTSFALSRALRRKIASLCARGIDDSTAVFFLFLLSRRRLAIFVLRERVTRSHTLPLAHALSPCYSARRRRRHRRRRRRRSHTRYAAVAAATPTTIGANARCRSFAVALFEAERRA